MMHSATNALSILGLSKNYGQFQVLKDLELTVATGAIHGLVGLNGSGKTTTLECLLGLQTFASGEIQVLGQTPDRLHSLQGKVAAIFDAPSLHPDLTVHACLQQAQWMCAGAVHSPEEVAAWLGISRYLKFKIRQLSLGNRRRAAIAHALIGGPRLIILDEPFNGLDAGGVDDVLQLIADLNRDQGISFLLSSHQLPYLEQVCTHIAVLHAGRIARSDAIETLLSSSEAQALIRTPDNRALEKVLAQDGRTEVVGSSTEGLIRVNLKELDSAELNRLLVREQIAVQELILERATLDRMFRELTREAGP